MWKGLIKKIRNFEVITEIEVNEDDRICLENPIQLLMTLKIIFKTAFYVTLSLKDYIDTDGECWWQIVVLKNKAEAVEILSSPGQYK